MLLGVIGMYAKDTGQQTFSPDVRSLSVYNPDNFMAPPVIRVGSNDRLNINFDIIGNQHEYLKFRLIHCNADWQPSKLMDSEFIQGFNEFEIADFAYSSNTYIHYVNYNISLPDPEVPIIASGNYLVQVFPENEPDNVILQARFSVAEQLAYFNGYVSTRTDKGYNDRFQQLFMNLDTSAIANINPYQDIKLVVTQNNNPATTRIISHPLRVENGKVFYEHSPQLIFEAGNEFRRFETVRADYPGMNVDSVKFLNGIWNSWLTTDFSRKNKEYTFDSTQHGRFKIDEYNSTDPDLSADYILVNFKLDPGERIPGKIYIEGDLSNHLLSDEFLMKYDWDKGIYKASLPLKQGSYNYQYVVVSEDGNSVSPFPIEGSKYETNNEYLVLAFIRPPGARADRLIASALF